ncbi:MAG: restriction endonuclease subunit S [Sulfuriferula sp.]
MSDVLNLPNSWVQVTIAELGKVVSGGTPSTKENSYWGGNISWISPSDLTGYSKKYISKGAKSITQEGLKNSSATIMPAGSIHFSSRAPIGYTVISSCDMTTNQGFKSLVLAQGVFNEYIYYYFKSAKQLAESKATGTTFKEISGAAFSKLPVPLPPTNEQHRIVAKIEELFSELDKGVENLKTARVQLKVYRQALLKHAFEGKLTAQWRAENQSKLETADALLKRIQQERAQRYQQQLAEWENKSPSVPLLQRGKASNTATSSIPPLKKGGRGDLKPKAPKPLMPLTAEELAELPELPEGWGWVKVDSYCDAERNSIKAGPFGSSLKKEFYVKEGYKVYGQEQVISGDWKYGDYFIDEARYLDLESCKVKPFDILISLVGTLGKVLVLPESITPGVINPRLVKISPNLNAVVPEFFKYYFESSFLKGLYKLKTHGATMDVLNLGIIQELPFPICSLKEQKFLIQEIEARLSEVDQLDQTITTSLQQAEALRQSILKKAFSGQLVPQDPHDEPASALLARIRAVRADTALKTKRKTT